ncbi:MAG: hypothetical protein KDK50_03595 [Chlamydiia bacterium]|nr:hypothetical protein [Chlamydiia bacterium]
MNWIIALLLAFSTSQTYKPPAEPLAITENLHGGRVLRLSDNSIWEVAPEDINYTQLWVTPFRVKIDYTGNVDYPYTLTNETSQTSVRVRHVDTMSPEDLPQEPPMPPGSVQEQKPITPSKPAPKEKTPKTPKQPKGSKTPPSTSPYDDKITPGNTQDPNQLPGSTPNTSPANPFGNN